MQILKSTSIIAIYSVLACAAVLPDNSIVMAAEVAVMRSLALRFDKDCFIEIDLKRKKGTFKKVSESSVENELSQ